MNDQATSKIQSINPKNGTLDCEFEPAAEESIETSLEAAASAYSAHRNSGFAQRVRRMERLADGLQSERQELARLMTDEMGKTLQSALAEVDKCAWVCRYYAQHAEKMLSAEDLQSDAGKSSVANLPLGPVLLVMPWNFPAWQVMRAAVPAVMAGNVVLLKHASNVPRTALRLQAMFEAAGFDPGIFQTLLIASDQVEKVLSDSRVKAVTVTGSMRAGSSVAALAGKHLKKSVLELGGSDPFIVMPSACLDQALDAAVTSRTMNNGQSCIAAKRFIVHADVFDRFLESFVRRFEELVVGDPLNEATDVGPLAMDRLRQRLSKQVESLVDRGAERLTGAEPMGGPGYYYRPGVLCGVSENAKHFDEEMFGPVAWVQRARSLNHALEIGNATQYGLGSSVWTRDPQEADLAQQELDCGATFVNALVASDPGLPFGGINCSGYGRELSKDGILEFVNRKTLVQA